MTIEITRDRIDIAVRRGGRVIGSRRLQVDLDGDWRAWVEALNGTVHQVSKAVADLDAVGAPTTVFYRSPTLAVEASGIAIRNESDAAEAARLACLDATTFPREIAATNVITLAKNSHGGSRTWQLLSAADRDDVLRAITELVRGVGLKLRAIVPTEAGASSVVVRRLCQASGGTIGTLHIGEQCSFFAVRAGGTLRFARRINLGFGTLVRSLLHEFTVAEGGRTVALSVDDAATLLTKFGIPSPDDVLDEERDIRGANILPLLQPVLQRLLVELRQSIRFGLESDQRAELEIDVLGAGSLLPGMTDLLRKELKVRVTAASSASFNPLEIGSAASDHEIAVTVWNTSKCPDLLPKSMASVRRHRQVRRLSFVGAAAALAIVVFDAFQLDGRISQAQERATSLAAQADGMQALHQTRDKVMVLNESMRTLDQHVTSAMRGAGNFDPLMRELAVVTPQSIRLTSFSIAENEQARLTVGITGYAVETDGRTGDEQLSRYLAALRESELVRAVALRTVHGAELDDAVGVRFEVNIDAEVWSDGIVRLTGLDATGGVE